MKPRFALVLVLAALPLVLCQCQSDAWCRFMVVLAQTAHNVVEAKIGFFAGPALHHHALRRGVPEAAMIRPALVLLLAGLAGCAGCGPADGGVDWPEPPRICPLGQSCEAPAAEVLTLKVDGGVGGAGAGGSGAGGTP